MYADQKYFSVDKAAKFFDEAIEEAKYFNDLLEKVIEGEYKVFFHSWFFSGGHGLDALRFDLVGEKETILFSLSGELNFGLSNEHSLHNTFFFSSSARGRLGQRLHLKAKIALFSALYRDDKEFAKAITINGKKYLPCDEDMDWTRESVLSGRWEEYLRRDPNF